MKNSDSIGWSPGAVGSYTLLMASERWIGRVSLEFELVVLVLYDS
jgi:hypothetical protein